MIYMPTELLKARGHKLQGVMKFQGLIISIENKKGSCREGTDSDGHKWKSYMYLDYGGIRNTEGKDGEYVDAYIGPAHDSDRVFVVHQNDPVTGNYDEDKCILGLKTAREAKKAYIRQYDRPGFFGSMDEYSMDEFKELLKKRKGIKLKKSKEIKKMTINDATLDTSLELALSDLRKNLEPKKNNTGEEVGRIELLSKAREKVKDGSLDLVTAGVIEGRINRGIPLDKGHRVALGLGPAKIKGLSEPAASNVTARMGGKTPGGSGAKIDLGTGSPIPINPIIEEMSRGQTLLHSFQQPNNEIMKVTGREILLKCRQLIREGRMNLLKAGDIERAVNGGAVIRPEVLRELFSI